ncbi:hypothetical protein [Radiobacillus sp. PE A8.2]|uniref:hypothetical protein n=1 Tax=Radiobacillus sp. PE A8.2 TaxID=3380349 RepID=UPI00388ED58F
MLKPILPPTQFHVSAAVTSSAARLTINLLPWSLIKSFKVTTISVVSITVITLLDVF